MKSHEIRCFCFYWYCCKSKNPFIGMFLRGKKKRVPQRHTGRLSVPKHLKSPVRFDAKHQNASIPCGSIVPGCSWTLHESGSQVRTCSGPARAVCLAQTFVTSRHELSPSNMFHGLIKGVSQIQANEIGRQVHPIKRMIKSNDQVQCLQVTSIDPRRTSQTSQQTSHARRKFVVLSVDLIRISEGRTLPTTTFRRP